MYAFFDSTFVILLEIMNNSANFYVGIPKPNVRLIRSSGDRMSIHWSVTAPQYVTNYKVYWSGPSIEMDYSTISTQYTISGLVSNTPYTVTVEAVSPLGRINSTTLQLYTIPTSEIVLCQIVVCIAKLNLGILLPCILQLLK